MKEIYPWTESLKSVQARVMEKSRIIVHLHIAVVIMLRKTLIALWQRRWAKIIFDKTSFRILLLWKPWHFELYVWSSLLARFRVRDRNSASGSSSESPRPPWWFFVAGKEPGLLRFTSKHSTPWGVFRKDRIVGAAVVDSPVLSAKKESELKLGSSSVTARDFCSRPIRARSSRTVSSSAHWKLVSYGLHRQLCLFSWDLLQML